MTIRNITDLVRALDFDALEELEKFMSSNTYPVALTHDDEKVILTTDADRVPFTKVLRYPFTDSDYDDAIVGLQCVTDYAMKEGYWHTHKDLFDSLAIRYAEKHGIIEYKVNQNYMEYWSLYEDGFYFIRIELNTDEREEVCHLPWTREEGLPIPAFLLAEVKGFTKYNYFEG